MDSIQSPSVPSSETLESMMPELIGEFGEEQVIRTFLEKFWEKDWSAFLDSIKLKDMIQKMENLIEPRVEEEEDAKTDAASQQHDDTTKEDEDAKTGAIYQQHDDTTKEEEIKEEEGDAKTGDISVQDIYSKTEFLIKTRLLPDLQFLMIDHEQGVKQSLLEKFCRKKGSKPLLRLSFQSIITKIQDQFKLIGEKEIRSIMMKECNELETIKPSTEFLTSKRIEMETTDRDQAEDQTSKGERSHKLEKGEASTGFLTSKGIVRETTHDQTEDHPHLMEFLKKFDDLELLTLREGLMLVEKSKKDGLEKLVKKFHLEGMKLTRMVLDTAIEEDYKRCLKF